MRDPIHDRRQGEGGGLFHLLALLTFLAGLAPILAPLPARAGESLANMSQVAESSPLPGLVSPGSAPVSPPPPKSRPAPLFRHGKRLLVKAGHPRRAVWEYVANRLFPHPSPKTLMAVGGAIKRLLGTPGPAISIGPAPAGSLDLLSVSVRRSELDRMGEKLSEEVREHPASGTIGKVLLSGVLPKDTDFIAKNLGAGPGSPLSSGPLSDNLFALSQLPGFARADAVLVPTALPGVEDLVVKTTPSSTFAGSQIEVDNYGYAAIGQVTVNGTLEINNTLLTGDQWTVAASGTPFGTVFFGMASGTLSYSAPMDLSNRLGVDISALDYQIGGGWSPWGHGAAAAQLVALGLSGSNYSFDGWESHAFVRKASASLALKGTLFLKEFQDTYSPTVQNDRSILGGTLDLSGIRSVGAWSGSFDVAGTEYDLTEGSGSSSANPFYTSTPGIQNFWTENGGVRYALSPVYAVYLSTVDQEYIGGGALDPMLQGVLGGMSNVRALPTATLFGNDLFSGSLAFLRTDVEKGGSLISSLFFDAGNVTGIGFSYGAMGPGVEESWTGAHLFAKADLAVPVGPLPTAGLGSQIVALSGGNIGSGGIPIQFWMSAGWRY